MNKTPALAIAQIEQCFRQGFWMKSQPVLSGISFEVPIGSVFGLMGANGAGKTTLIHLIGGLKRPSRGSIQVFGFEAISIEAKCRIGYLPERPYFYPHLTGNQILSYFGTLGGMLPSRIRVRIPEVLKTVGLSEAADVELNKYSKGMLQRIGIAQAMIHDPELLVFDEPMSGLDPQGRKEIQILIRDLAREGRTVFFTTHVASDAEILCDQIGWIEKGKLVRLESPKKDTTAKGQL